MNTTDAKRVLETALICAQQPLPLREMGVLFNGVLTADSLKLVLEELQNDWAGRGVELVHARQLVALVQAHAARGLSCKFNLIPFNPFPASGLKRSDMPQVAAFAKILMDAGIVTTVRKTRGDDIDAACGQLAGDVQDRTGVEQRMAAQRQGMLGGIKVVVARG